MRRPLELPPELRSTHFSTSTAAVHGVGAWRLRVGSIEHPFYGVNTLAGTDEPGQPDRPGDVVRQLCDAYLVRMLPGQWFSHDTGAALVGIPLPPNLPTGSVHVSVRAPRTPPRAAGVAGHRISADVRVGLARDKYPTCSPVDLWCQLSTRVGRSDLVAAGDFLVGSRNREPVAYLAELVNASERFGGKRGAVNRAWALERIRFGADSAPETLLRLRLVEAGLPEPDVQPPVAVADGNLVLHPDLLLPDARVTFEYEGDGHRVDRRQWQLDIDREELFRRAGYEVVRVTAQHLFGRRQEFDDRLQRLGLLLAKGARSGLRRGD
ncbi:hypothetical protein ACPPVQ_05110 [Diaminobutyricibacter sp. McL0618]|uniref:hypothetical protein n=1 Tax=Leifsonia sp. McL0618 TaxID=3415677 RepID=UPI003CED7FFC